MEEIDPLWWGSTYRGGGRGAGHTSGQRSTDQRDLRVDSDALLSVSVGIRLEMVEFGYYR